MNGAKHTFSKRLGILFALAAFSGVCGYLALRHSSSTPEEPRSDPVVEEGRMNTGSSGSTASSHSADAAGESSEMDGEEFIEADSSSNWEHPAWPGSLVLETLESEPDQNGVFRRVTVVSPPDLSYPVRIEE